MDVNGRASLSTMASPVPQLFDGGKKIGKYVIGPKIGSGAFSVVKLAYDTEFNRQVAVKIISKEELKKNNKGELIRREVQIHHNLTHPFIVRMYEVFQTPNNVYIVLEFIHGCDLLDAIIASHGLHPDVARSFLQHIVVALLYTHSFGIAHRDLKPENILIGSESPRIARLTDFGLAKAVGQGHGEEIMHSICGTVDYIAPEVLRQQGYDGRRADLWSLGVLLYAMLANSAPFFHPDVAEMYRRIARGAYSMHRKIPRDAADLISRLILVNPDDRLSLRDVLHHPFFTTNFAGSTAAAVLVTTPPSEPPQVALENAEHAPGLTSPTTSGDAASGASREDGMSVQSSAAAAATTTGAITAADGGHKGAVRAILQGVTLANCRDRLVTALRGIGVNVKVKREEPLLIAMYTEQPRYVAVVMEIAPTSDESLRMMILHRGGDPETFDFLCAAIRETFRREIMC